jgi:hypothetical protein
MKGNKDARTFGTINTLQNETFYFKLQGMNRYFFILKSFLPNFPCVALTGVRQLSKPLATAIYHSLLEVFD